MNTICTQSFIFEPWAFSCVHVFYYVLIKYILRRLKRVCGRIYTTTCRTQRHVIYQRATNTKKLKVIGKVNTMGSVGVVLWEALKQWRIARTNKAQCSNRNGITKESPFSKLLTLAQLCNDKSVFISWQKIQFLIELIEISSCRHINIMFIIHSVTVNH